VTCGSRFSDDGGNSRDESARYRVKRTYERPHGGFLAIGPRYPGVRSADGVVMLFTHLGDDQWTEVVPVEHLEEAPGVVLTLRGDVPAQLAAVRRWDGTPLPPELRARLEREWARVTAVRAALRTLTARRHQRVTAATPAAADVPAVHLTRRLAALGAIGETTAWLLATEMFSWRCVSESAAGWGLCRLDGDAGPERGARARARAHAQRECRTAGAGDRARLELAALPAGERPQAVVPAALWQWGRPGGGGLGSSRWRGGC